MGDRKRRLDVGGPSEPPKQARSDAGAAAAAAAGGDSTINPYNGRAYSRRYYEVLEKRMQLPVMQFKEQIIKAVCENQTTVLLGETGMQVQVEDWNWNKRMKNDWF